MLVALFQFCCSFFRGGSGWRKFSFPKEKDFRGCFLAHSSLGFVPMLRRLQVRQEFSQMDFGQETGVNVFPLLRKEWDRKKREGFVITSIQNG